MTTDLNGHAIIWRPVVGHPHYLVSNAGGVFSVRRGRALKPFVNGGYYKVSLGKEHLGISVHRLVAAAFLGEPLEHVNHKDGNKLNNHVTNLEWVTAKDNASHAARIGLYPRGEAHHRPTLTAKQVEEVRELCKSGQPQALVAKQFGVSQSTVWRIVHRRVWAG